MADKNAYSDGLRLVADGDFLTVGGKELLYKAAAEIEAQREILDKLPHDADRNVYPPPNALKGKAFYHPEHLGPATRLFTQLFWHSDAKSWFLSSGGWDVPFDECFLTEEAAEAAKVEPAESEVDLGD